MTPSPSRRAVFLDRDGVLIEDVHLLTRADDIRVLPGVPEALQQLHGAGLQLIVVTNQTVVARGLCTEHDVTALQHEVDLRLRHSGAPPLDAFYFCPHHPNATLAEYRIACECRKPRAGLLLRAAAERGIDLANSFLVGDRMTDIAAGACAGCRTVWVQTGCHSAPLIQTLDPLDPNLQPDYICPGLQEAARWILKHE